MNGTAWTPEGHTVQEHLPPELPLLEEILVLSPLKGVPDNRSLNTSVIKWGEGEREMICPWPLAIWMRQWELGKEVLCGFVDGENKRVLCFIWSLFG